MLMRPTVATIHLDRLRKNVQWIRAQLNPHVKMMAVVKADAYGHGAHKVAEAALEAGAEFLGVALVEEGMALRRQGIQAPILVLGQVPMNQIAEAIADDLDMVVFDPLTFDQAVQAGQFLHKPVKIHLKVDTGMGRIGLWPDHFDRVWIERLRNPAIIFQGLMTHFANADAREERGTKEQVQRFLDVIEMCRENGLEPPFVHAANSAAALKMPGTQFNLVRIGIAMYGLEAYAPMPADLKPVLELTSQVVFIKTVDEGFAVGYGSTYITEKPMKIVTVPVGYADGYRRGLSNRAQVLIRGRRYPVIGRISMDQLTVGMDIDDPVAIGDPVVLIGEQGGESISADDLARLLDTIGYEIVSGLSPRIPRVYGN
ncbi:alanine racemase [Sulfobacillus thermosulfidooxidans DSM 9293]|uniref:Alanine racemase n=2 Tax=Sulfobacillus thermosulfidooxidans TaxID=28034 RepID=A0A1W1WGN9_SULTA|nr:alanine racemase [Sulfobacillus thermosulfidooxidans DSM 9293]